MPVRTLYDVLDVSPSATADEIKLSFRRQIARYHPDKVHHLGVELQEIAATRAAEITEAYRQLSNPETRAEYDQSLPRGSGPPPPSPPTGPAGPVRSEPGDETGPDASPADAPLADAGRFSQERVVRDSFVRKAALDRLRDITTAVLEGAEEVRGRGFEVAFLTGGKRGLLHRARPLLICGRFVPVVDAGTVEDVWNRAVRLGGISKTLCVFLMGDSLASTRELSGVIVQLREKLSRTSTMQITVVPVDVHDWQGPVPADTPAPARTILDRLHATGPQ